MKRFALATLACVAASAASWGQNAVTQNGTIIQQHLPLWRQDRQIGDIGGLLGQTSGPFIGRGAAPFSISDDRGIGLQFNDATTTGEFNYLGLGHNAAGQAIYNINGIEYPFGTGLGNVNGPTVTTVNEPAVWNSTNGTLLKNGLGANILHGDTQTGAIATGSSPFEVRSNSASAITHSCIWSAVNKVTPDCIYTALNPSPGYDGIRSVVLANAGSDTIWTSGFSSYVLNNVARNIGNPDANGTSYNYIGEMVIDPVSDSANASGWSMNTLCTDNYGQVVTASSNRACFGWEHDMNITSPNNGGIGIMLGGNSIVQPLVGGGGGVGFRGINLNRVDGYPGTGNTAKWHSFLSTTDGSTAVFAEINAVSPTASFTGAIAGTTLTVTAVASGTVGVDAFGNTTVNGAGVTAATRLLTQIKPLIGGETMGGIGRYTVSISQTVGPVAMVTSSASQAILTNAYSPTGTSVQTIQQLTPTGDYIVNVPFPGNFTIWSGGQKIAGFSRTLMLLEAGVGITAPGLNTVAIVAGSICAATDGTFIYKVGVNCF